MVLQISRQSIEACVSYSNFKKCCEKKKKEKKKYEENKTNSKGTYLGKGLVDSAQIWNWRCPTLRKLAQKKLCVSIQGVLNYRCIKMAFSLLL